jgi:hypothetical protein
MAFKMKGFSPFTQSEDLQKKYLALRKQLADAVRSGNTKLVRKLKPQIRAVESQMKKN